MYLPHILQRRKDLVHLTVPAGHAVIFTEACLHSGGANDSTKHLFRLFAYIVTGYGKQVGCAATHTSLN
jgi:hypothetical protein